MLCGGGKRRARLVAMHCAWVSSEGDLSNRICCGQEFPHSNKEYRLGCLRKEKGSKVDVRGASNSDCVREQRSGTWP